MKILLRITILGLVFYLCYSLLARDQTIDRNGANRDKTVKAGAVESKRDTGIKEQTPSLSQYDYDSSEIEDDDLFPYDQDFLTRKLFQKTLPPLTRKERIIWSFRMADSNAFL
jgi:hypothetical protein